MKKPNQIALVTGGSRGIGKEIALSFARKGVDVIVTYRDSEALAHTTIAEIEKLGAKGRALRLNLSEFKTLDAFMGQFTSLLKSEWGDGHFDFLVNNAGMGATIPMEKATEEQFDEFMNVHFKGVYFLTQKCLPLMRAGGRVINLSSGTTRWSNPGYSIYASMKGAVEVLTKYIAKEYGAKGIGANIVAPGPVETDFNNAAIRNNPQFKTMLGSMSPFGRVGNADDIGGVVTFLCSEEGRWINGQRIEASGGINV